MGISIVWRCYGMGISIAWRYYGMGMGMNSPPEHLAEEPNRRQENLSLIKLCINIFSGVLG